MANIRQNPDGSLGIFADAEGVEVARFGGPSTASVAVPKFRGTVTAAIPVVGPTDTAGALGAWQVPSGYGNVIIKRIILNVITQSAGACTVSSGVAANGTTLNAGMISGQTVAAVGVFTSTSVQTMTNAQFVTFSTASGASSGLVAVAYIEFCVA